MNSIITEKNYIVNNVTTGDGRNIEYSQLSQSYIRAETQLGTQSVITFQVQKGQVSTPLSTERLLQLNDEFVITNIFIGIKQIAADSPTALQHVAAPIYTWSDPNVFSGTNAVNTATIYNGNLSFTIDRTEYIPNFPMRSFLRVPDTQFADNAYFTASGIKTRDSFNNGLYGFYPCDPTVINGRQTLDININLGTSVAMDDASNSVWAVLELRGYLIVNAKS